MPYRESGVRTGGVRRPPARRLSPKRPDACVTGTPRATARLASPLHRSRTSPNRRRQPHPSPPVPPDPCVPSSVTAERFAGGEHMPSHMKEILDAILAPDSTAADFAALPLPESYRAVTVHKDEAEMFAGLATRDKDPRKSLHLEDVPVPELGPGEALVAVMASSVNYNTVWTSIFEPVSDLRLPGALRPAVAAHQAARPAVPRHRLRPGRRRAAHRARRQRVEARRRGRRALPVASSWSPPTGTTTRCSTPSSGSGASRPTSAASPRSRWSSPTS